MPRGIYERTAEHNRKIGEAKTTHGGSHTRLCWVWNEMKQRCFNENNKEYSRYGDRGITICAEWLDFAVFRDWALSNGYREGLTIDRIDNDKGYYPENCQWIPRGDNTRKDYVR